MDVSQTPQQPPLTPRQTQILQMLSRGKLRKQIAGSLRIRPGTVDRLAWQARERLGAENNVHAICEALRQGLIT